MYRTDKPIFYRTALAVAWVRFALLLVLWTFYVTAFWGKFSQAWPPWVRGYAGSGWRLLWRTYRDHISTAGNPYVHFLIAWVAASVLFAGLVPVLAMRLLGRSWGDMGLGMPNSWGRRILRICVLVSLPFAWFIAGEQPAASEGGRPFAQKLAMFASTVPEHILLTGICVASFLPGVRLPVPPPLASVEGGRLRRCLRWLGLAQPTNAEDPLPRRLWAWLGIDARAALAILGGGILFGIVHIGARPVEFATSFPGGAAICYVTFRSRSIWVGWIAHVTMMGVILLLMLLTGRG